MKSFASDRDGLTAVACQALRDLIGCFRFEVNIITIHPADASALWAVVRTRGSTDSDFESAPAPGLPIERLGSLHTSDMSLPAGDRGNQ